MLFLGYPVYAVVCLNNRMMRVDKDHFEPFGNAVFANPVRIQYFKVREFSSNALFTDQPHALGKLELLDTHTLGSSSSLRPLLPHAASSHADTNNNVALLGLVTKLPSFVQTRRLIYPRHNRLSAPFYKPMTHKLVHERFLRLSPRFSNILVRQSSSPLHLFMVQPCGHIPADFDPPVASFIALSIKINLSRFSLVFKHGLLD